jgi:hypothetical protein
MKKSKWILIGVAVLIAVFAVGVLVRAQIPSQATIAITGKAGQHFSGIIHADGIASPMSGIVPTNFIVTGGSVECRFQKSQAAGELGVYMGVRSLDMSCSAATSKPGGGVCTFFSFLKCGSYTF